MMGQDTAMKMLFESENIQVYFADEHFTEPGIYVWWKDKCIIKAGVLIPCSSCAEKDAALAKDSRMYHLF